MNDASRAGLVGILTLTAPRLHDHNFLGDNFHVYYNCDRKVIKRYRIVMRSGVKKNKMVSKAAPQQEYLAHTRSNLCSSKYTFP